MIKERIEKLKSIAQKTGTDFRILHHDGVSDKYAELVAVRTDLDKKIMDLEELVCSGKKIALNDIRSEIDWLLELMGYTLEINHLPAAHKAIEARNLLEEPQRFKLSPLIEEIKKFRLRIRQKAAECNAPDICRKCGGGCCGRDIEKEFAEMDFFYMFYVLRNEQVNKIWEILKKPDKADSNCRFQGKDGCVIPVEGRPSICQMHYCEDIPIIGEPKKTDSYAIGLAGKTKKLQKRLKKMGFDLEIND